MKRALVYVRASLDATGEGQSVARQEEACRALAVARGWEVVAVERDNSISAYGEKRRPGWERVLEAIEGREVEVVIAWHLDRMTRSMLELERLILRAEEAGVGIATAVGDIDLTTDTGRMVARILAAVARAEVERKAARQALANAARAARGLPHSGGVRSFGYERDGLTVVEAEAAAIRQGARDVLDGVPLPEIARSWDRAGLPSARASKARGGWTANGVRGVLTNPRMAGVRVYNGVAVGEGQWEAILDLETHLAVRALLTDPGRGRGSVKTGRTPTTLLTGIARCVGCGEVLSGASVRGKLTYQCRGCKRVSIHRELLDEEVTAWVLERLSRPDALVELVPEGGDEVEAARERAADLRRRLDGLVAAFSTGAITLEQLTSGSATLKAALEDAEKTLAASQTGRALEGLVGVADVWKAWEAASLPRKRAVVAALFEVKVAPMKVGGERIRVTDRAA